jgi:PAS domain S-box-containing protein
MNNADFLKQQTVLFVEDEDLAREKLAKFLGKIFKRVIVAQNGLEGLEKFKISLDSSERVDLIVSDINMPLMSGLEMLENIRNSDNDIPVIFTTARNEIENILKAIDLNITGYILKPIDTITLMKKLAEVCEKKYFKLQLEEKQNELKKYLQAVDNVALIYKMNDKGKILFANNSFLEISKYNSDEIEDLNFNDLIHPDIPKDFLDKTWETLRNGKIWNGNTKFIDKNQEVFYLKNTIFKLESDSNIEYITIGFSTTKENNEKREFQRKVIKAIEEFNKKEFTYKKTIEDLTTRNRQLEIYLPIIQNELEEQKAKTLSRQRQLEHYELQMHNVDEKYYDRISNKKKEADEYAKNILTLKQEKSVAVNKLKKAIEEIDAMKKELLLLMKSNEEKLKRINDLNDVIKSLEVKIRELTEENEKREKI